MSHTPTRPASRRSRLAPLLGALALAGMALPATAAVNLVANGSFAAGLTHWTQTGVAGHSSAVGSAGAFSTPAPDQAVLLSSVGEGIVQTFGGLVAGQTYLLDSSFGQTALADPDPGAAGITGPTVSIGVFGDPGFSTTLLSFDLELDPYRFGSPGSLGTSFVLSFVASGPQATLRYLLAAPQTLDLPTAQLKVLPLIDQVSVTAAIPEPGRTAQLALGLAGLLGLGLLRRQRRA